MNLTKPFYTLVAKHFLNHVQLEKPLLDEPNKNERCFGNKCQKHQNGHIFIFTNPNEVIQIYLERPWKYLTGEINLASKFHVFF